MAEITECPVCFEEFQDPKLLPCSHTLCLKCLETLEKDGYVTCPMCNAKHKVPDRGVKAFTDNQHAAQLIAYSQKLKELEKRLTTQVDKVSDPVGKATIEQEPHTEQSTGSMQEAAKEKTHSAVTDNSEKGAEALIAALETNGAVSMVTANQQHETGGGNQETETPSVRPKEKTEFSPAELLSYCRQRFPTIESEYDPKRCNNCGKTEKELGKCECCEIDITLKSCTKCKVARYCSQKCQITDWKKRHKTHCDELHKLRTIIQHESYKNTHGSHEVKQLKASLDGDPYPVSGEIMFPCLLLHEDKQLIQYVQGRFVVTAVYNTSTGSEERVICRKPNTCTTLIDGLGFIQVNKELYITVAFGDDNEMKKTFAYSIEFWPYSDQADEPAYIYTTKDKRLGLMYPFENTLLISNEKEKTIEEWDATSFPIKPTGLVIPVGETLGGSVRGICVMKQGDEKLLLVQREQKNRRDESSYSLRCLDFKGQVLWVKPIIKSGCVCTDHRGHYIFKVGGTGEHKVSVLHSNLTTQILINCPGQPASIAWCNKSGRLYVVHRTYGGVFVTARFAIDELDQTEEGQEKTRKETATQKEENTKAEIKNNDEVVTRNSALTFYRQKLALIQCGYDPKSCNCCGRHGPVETLKRCIKCRTAFYCSKECQVKDWKPKHKADCKEIQRLKEMIEKEEFRGENILIKAIPARKPWLLDVSQVIPTLTCVINNTQLVYGMGGLVQYNSEGKVLAKYNPRTGPKSRPAICFGLCAFYIGASAYIALSSGGTRGQLEIWPLPLQPSSGPVYIYNESSSCFSSFCLFEGRLLAANIQQVQEFDISSIEVKSTGFNIPITRTVRRMCAFREDGERRLLYTVNSSITMYGAEEQDSHIMECIDFTGKLLWRLGDGITFQPTTVRVDKKGRIFAIDWFDRVVTVNKDLSIQTVFQHEGAISDISFCDVTNKLYVIHAIDAQDVTYCSAVFDIIAEDSS